MTSSGLPLTFSSFKKRFDLSRRYPSRIQKYYSNSFKSFLSIAQQHYKGVILNRSVDQWIENVHHTCTLLQQNEVVICNASVYSKGLLAVPDLLIKKNNHIEISFFKPALRISGFYLLEAAFTMHVFNLAGICVDKISLVTVNKNFTLKDSLNPSEYLNESDVTNDVIPLINDIISKLNESSKPQESLRSETFVDKTDEVLALFSSDINDILEQGDNHEFNVKHPDKLKELLNNVSYPMGFLDVETYMPTIPIIKGTKPFQHIPFHYSLHYQKNKHDRFNHNQCIADFTEQGISAFYDLMYKDVSFLDTVVSFDAATENASLAKTKMPLKFKMLDLSVPFVNGWIVHKNDSVTFSLKSILEQLLGKNYYEMLPVQNGREAMAAYEALISESDSEKRSEIANDIYIYGKLDTFSLVILYRWLCSIS